MKTDPLHVLLIHQAFAGPNDAGGTRHYELGRRFVAEDRRFTVVASDVSYLTGERIVRSTKAGSKKDGSKKKGPKEEDLDGVRVVRARTVRALHRSFVWRVISFLSFTVSSVFAALAAGKVDLVMGTTPPIFQAVSAWLVSRLRRRPLLLEVRDLWPEFAIDLGVLKNPLLISISRRLEGFLYKAAAHIVVNSPAYRDYLLTKGVADAKITVIPNGVDAAAFAGVSGVEMRRSFGLDGQFVVTYAGALGMANDIPAILNAAERLRECEDVRFLLVGDGKDRMSLEAMAREKGLRNVIFAGARPKSEMPAIIAASDVCLATLKNIPMFTTTYPNKVFDYMAAGRPTVLAIDGVIRKVLEEAGGGIFVPPGDDAALASAIKRLRAEPETAAAMGRSARDHVTRHFDRAEQARQFVALIERLAGGRA